MKKIVIMGAGGFGAEAIWALEEMNKLSPLSDQWNILGYVDDDKSKKGKVFYNYQTLGTPGEVDEIYSGNQLWYFCAIGDNRIRSNIVKCLDELAWKAATLIHPSAVMAKNIEIGEGSYIGPASVICPNAIIGKHVLINTRVAIGHDVIMENFSQACPGAQINGFCKIGHSSFIGSNASIMPGTKIGEKATVGGNSQVLRAVKSGTTVNGVPAIKVS